MAKITLYHFPASAPSRTALLAARAVGINVDVEHLDLFKKEQLSEKFTKINPQHTVPTLVDDDFVLWESRAIAIYLVNKYGNDDALYPKDLKKQAVVNQRLFFDATTLHVKIRAICFPVLYHGETSIPKTKKDDLNVSLKFMDGFLEDRKWLAGDHYTLADISCYATLSSILAVGWDISAFPYIVRWVKDCGVLPGFDENQAGAKIFGDAVRKNLKQ